MTDNEIAKAKEHYEYGITHDIFKEPVLSYARTALWAFDEINRQKAEIDILIRKKDALRDEIAEQQAEIERLQKIIVGFMDEVGTWSNKYDVDISSIHKLPILAKEDWNIRHKIKSEAIKEFEKFVTRRLNCNTPRGAYLLNIMDEVKREMTE